MSSESKIWESMAGMSQCGCVQSAGGLSCHLVLSFAGVQTNRKTTVRLAGSGAICIAGE